MISNQNNTSDNDVMVCDDTHSQSEGMENHPEEEKKCDELQSMESIDLNMTIDGRYKIISRFSDSTELYKMVFLAVPFKGFEDEICLVVKVYTKKETNDFLSEVERNKVLPDQDDRVIKMTNFVGTDKVEHPLIYNGQTIDLYSYIVMPFCENGTLLDLLLKVVNSNATLSVGLQKYLSKQMAETLAHLHNDVGLAHLDIKIDNIVIRNDLKLALIDFGHTNWAH